jgi:hypothetical protein
MKTLWIKTAVLSSVLASTAFYAQNSESIPNLRPNDQRGINVFENNKTSTSEFDGIKLNWGAAFTAQYQNLKHENGVDYTANPKTSKLYDLKSGLQVPMANLYMDVQLADGIRLNVTSYMSSRHHNEFYVKGGYLQIDKLPFIKSDLVDKIMEKVTIKAGQFENNYGDQHFRRTDGGQAIYNPFIENYIADAFMTEVGGEVYYQANKELMVMAGVTSGSIKGHVTTPKEVDGETTRSLSVLGKVSWDKKVSDDFRVRLSGSIYHNPHNGGSGLTIYGGDRTGSNYQLVMEATGKTTTQPVIGANGQPTGEYISTFTASNPTDNAFSGRFNPGFNNKVTAMMFNAFAKYQGLEFFGTYETANGRAAGQTKDRNMTQLAGDLIYRFGGKENFFLGARYNTVRAELNNITDKVSVDRFALGAGWFMTKNILMKAEYVNQNYKDYPATNMLYKGKFDGITVEATVSF